MTSVKLDDADAIGDQPVASPREEPVDGQLVPHLPMIGTSLGTHDMRHMRGQSGGPTIGVGGKEPRVNDVRTMFAQKPHGAAPRQRVDLPAFA